MDAVIWRSLLSLRRCVMELGRYTQRAMRCEKNGHVRLELRSYAKTVKIFVRHFVRVDGSSLSSALVQRVS